MIFGNSNDFAIEAFHEPRGPQWHGFGRLCIHIQGFRIGDIQDKHCSLFHVTDRCRELRETIDSLWDPSFAQLSNAEIFALLDQEIYLGEPPKKSPQHNVFDFLTNTGEMFDGAKTFIFSRPAGRVHILYQFSDNVIRSGSCSVHNFRQATESYVGWFDERLREATPQYFSP